MCRKARSSCVSEGTEGMMRRLESKTVRETETKKGRRGERDRRVLEHFEERGMSICHAVKCLPSAGRPEQREE